jgi:8-oxo-dGTP pyrophosphatase MutT (NUDIX family)
MTKFTWFRNSVPEQLPVKQVYGIAFSADNRVVLRIEDGKYKLTGGKPENAETFEETLRREYIEELNIELEDFYYLGHLLVEDNSDKYAQVRMIAKIKAIYDSHIDPATGKVYGRELVTVDRVKDYLNYSDRAGNEMIDDAVQLAMDNYL